MVFTLPDEFGYPPITNLDSCDRFGVEEFINKPPLFDCYLKRPYKDRFITFYPDENPD